MIHFAIPGDIQSPTGGYAYARRILAAWQNDAEDVVHLALPGGFPHPTDNDLRETARRLDTARGPLLIDGLAYGAFPQALAARIGPRSTVLLHHPLCDETGLSKAQAGSMFETERVALAEAARVVATSPSTARDLAGRFGVPQTRLSVAVPGLDPAPPAHRTNATPCILAVGSLTPRKGYRDLLAALATCTDLPWRCIIIGSAAHNENEAAALASLAKAPPLNDRVVFAGARPAHALSDAYRDADIFVSASYHEGYGMAVAEAAMHGLAVVAARVGALSDTLPCARFVTPGTPAELASVLRTLLSDDAARLRLGDACRAHALSYPGWQDTARQVLSTIKEVRDGIHHEL